MKLQVYHDPWLQFLTEAVPSAEIAAVKKRCREIQDAALKIVVRNNKRMKGLVTEVEECRRELKKTPIARTADDVNTEHDATYNHLLETIKELQYQKNWADQFLPKCEQLQKQLQTQEAVNRNLVNAHSELSNQNARLVDQVRRLLQEKQTQPPVTNEAELMENFISRLGN